MLFAPESVLNFQQALFYSFQHFFDGCLTANEADKYTHPTVDNADVSNDRNPPINWGFLKLISAFMTRWGGSVGRPLQRQGVSTFP